VCHFFQSRFSDDGILIDGFAAAERMPRVLEIPASKRRFRADDYMDR
jgi:hypothetical protein